MKAAVNVPVGRIIRLVTKAIRLGKHGYTREELQELAADLLDLGATVLTLSEGRRE